MDSITHIALGACIGEALLGKSIGKKALLWGALAQSLPDIDVIAGCWMPLSEELLAHRGFSHSILFIVLCMPLLAISANRIHRIASISVKKWMIFFAVEMLVHIFLDTFNNYGTGWLEPFSHQRFSFNVLYVADPFFSIWPLISAIVLVSIPITKNIRKWFLRAGLILPVLYLSYCVMNKFKIDGEAREILSGQMIPADRYFTTPTPLNNWLWYIVSGNDSGFYVGYRSVFDSEKKIAFEYFPRNEYLLQSLTERESLQQLKRFSQGFYTVEKWGDSLVFNDLRFGQIIGWKEPKEKFVFHFYLEYPGMNKMVVQRGRFARWDKDVFSSLLKRISGN